MNHVGDEIVLDHIVNVHDVEEDASEHVDVKVKDEDGLNLDVETVLKDGYVFIVDAVNFWYVDEVEVNVELSDDVHSADDKVDDKVGIAEDDLIDVNAVVSQDFDVRVDDEITRIVTVSPTVVVALDVDRKAGNGDDLDDAARRRK